MMELYATGFNAWNQLRFDGANTTNTTDPEDLSGFTCVLQDDAIDGLRPYFSYTLVNTAAGLRSAGLVPKEDAALHTANHNAYLDLVQAANGVVAVYDGTGNIHQYSSMGDLVLGRKQAIYSGFPRLVSLVAYDAGFAALSATGRVWTWGDERYGACLGREVTDAAPATKPREVTDLRDLPTGPVAKLAACGYLLTAITTGNDMYAWGGHPGRRAIVEGVSERPGPVLIDERDIVDVGVGDSHLIALTVDGQVFVVGDNKNGQLGLAAESAPSWTEIKLELGEKQHITGVMAGPKNSFIIVGTK
ncbi:RCC1/BLIP-II [Thozetella sp. PMI_491]|nr:RCC1/BLIP-II [Thozetella sp. PMI_491]